MTFAELFTRYGYPQMSDIVAATGLSYPQLSGLWYGDRRLGARLAKRISQQTGIPIEALLYATPLPHPGRRGRRKCTGSRPHKRTP